MFAFLPAAPLLPRSCHESHEIWHKGRQAVKDPAPCGEPPDSAIRAPVAVRWHEGFHDPAAAPRTQGGPEIQTIAQRLADNPGNILVSPLLRRQRMKVGGF
jgi:hypothetical protein